MDFRFALRSLWKNPGFTILAVLVMALGIGANTAVFSVVNSVLLKPLEYRSPEQIVSVASLWKRTGSHGQASAPDFHDWHDQSTSFSAMAYYVNGETVLTAGSAAEYGRVAAVTAEFLDVFQVQPVAGRWFNGDELKPDSGGAAVISYAFWQSHYGGKPDAVGQKIRLFDRLLSITGVLPPRFEFPEKNQIWIPANTIFAETKSRSAHNYIPIARLKPNVTVAQAQAEMSAIGSRLEQAYQADNAGKSVSVALMLDTMVGNLRETFYLLLGAVALVLLIACSNVANLLLAKATGRSREIAIRAAIGASRGRIVRLLIAESLLLAIASGVAGLTLAVWGSSALVALAPANIPRLEETAIDAGVLAFTFVISILASLLFGLAPALQASRVDLNDTLKQGANRAMGGAAGRIRAALVVAEIALSVVLLTGAGLLMKSFVALHNVALGFRPGNVLVMGTSVPSDGFESAQRAMRFYRQLLAEIRTIPGVIAAGATRVPPGRIMSNGGFYIDHLPAPEARTVKSPQAVFSVISPGTIGALGIPLKAGRDFNERDTFDVPFSALVNEALVKQAFAGQNPIGRTLYWGFDNASPMTIVGVVGDVRQTGPAADARPEIYAAHEQHPGASTNLKLVIRTTAEPTAIADTLRRKAREISTDVPVRFTTMEASLAENVAAPRFRTLLFGIFAGLAVSLAMAGVYGVMAYTVGQRANEIGLRMALGASPGNVMGLVMGQGLKLAGIGLAIGLAAAATTTNLLSKMLFEVKPTDPLTYVEVALLLGAVALGACYFPARRATKVDPLVALRND